MTRLLLLTTLLVCALPAQAWITYQGQLKQEGQPYTGTAEVRFSLWNSAQAGTELADHTSSVQVFDGLFQEEVNFGTLHYDFPPGFLWIEVEVLQPGPATTLAPRQRIRSAPRAYMANRARHATAGLYSGTVPFRVQGPDGDVFRAGRVGGQVRVGIGSGTPNAHLSIGSNLDFWSMGGDFTADRPTIRGTASDNLSLSAAGGGAVHINSDGGTGGIRFYDGSGGSLGEMMRITGDGRVGIGGTPDEFATLDVHGFTYTSGLVLRESGTTGGDSLCRTTLLGLVAPCASSRRYKENIEMLEQASSLLTALRPVRYTWKEDGRADLGLIAEEVAEVIPELVSRGDNGEIRGVNFRHLTGVLIAGWQEQQTEIATQQSEIVALRTEYHQEVAALNAELAELRALADRATDAEARLAALEALLLDGSEVANAAR